jgi:DNA mismatch repair protein MutS2
MIYPDNIESKLGFDKIRTLLKEECQGTMGRELVAQMAFSTDYAEIAKNTEETAEFVKLITLNENPPESYYLDVSAYLQKAAIENSFLTESEFADLKNSLTTLYQTVRLIKRQPQEEFPRLRALCAEVEVPYQILEALSRVIDEQGRLRSNASPELQKIRQEIIRTQAFLRKRIEQILKNAKSQDYTKEDVEITLREGRMVIPVKTEYRKQVRGIIHDSSATGQTVFIEPEEIIELNNDIKQLTNQEKREIIRILTALTNEIRPYLGVLTHAYSFLAHIDFVRAKARLAVKIKALNPHFENRPLMKWHKAYHPLLLLSYQKQNKTVVPHTITLDGHKRILLISGPNAGGKSVALKMTGLIQYMYQCGLLVPMEEGSRMGIFQDIFVDIGDEQSLENDLSTYSSHLTNMKKLLFFGKKSSLCLIDEFGTGTEPQIGAAIAEAILEQLEKQRVFAVITTHYANLKLMAERLPTIVNGAMRFDVENMEPLFQLEMGKPGSSFALEIAKKIGLPKDVLQNAASKVGNEQVEMEKLLRSLEKQNSRLMHQNQEAQNKRRLYEKLVKEYEKAKLDLETNRKKMLNEAKREAKLLLKQANQKIEETIRLIKEGQAEKEITKLLRKELAQFQDQNLREEEVVSPLETPIEDDTIAGEIGVGDWVRLQGQSSVGEVIELRGKDAVVQVGVLKTTVALKKLLKVNKKAYANNTSAPTRTNISSNLHERALHFSTELDLRGKRAEEAQAEVEAFLDEALMLNQKHLRILHGKGNGVLRQIVRDTLRQYKEIREMKDEHADRGGAGITLVEL